MAAWSGPGFVALIVGQNNKAIREFEEDGKRTVRIPFGTEYKLRFFNKTNARAYVRVEIDGMDALSGKKLIMEPNCTKDLERFLQGDNLRGNKFKFVEASNAGVTDPTAGENGLVRVIFEPEAISTTTFTTHTTGTLSGGFVTRAAHPIYGSPNMPSNFMCNTSGVGEAMSVGPTLTANNVSTSVGGTNAVISSMVPGILHRPALPADLGATAAGSASAQQFQDSSEFFYTLAPVTLDIWVKGLKVEQPRPFTVQNRNHAPIVINGVSFVGCTSCVSNDFVSINIPRNLVDLR